MPHPAEDTLPNLQARLASVRASIARAQEDLEIASAGRDDRQVTYRRISELEASERNLMDRISRMTSGGLMRFVPKG